MDKPNRGRPTNGVRRTFIVDRAGRSVFISYAREDLPFAMRLFADLKRRGERPWLDLKSLLPGQEWESGVNRAIRESDYFIAMLSSRSVSKKGYVQREIREALSLLDTLPSGRVYVIPIRLDNCQPSHEKLEKLHRIDMFPGNSEWSQGLREFARVFDTFTPRPRKETFRNPPERVTLTFSREVAAQIDELQKDFPLGGVKTAFVRTLVTEFLLNAKRHPQVPRWTPKTGH